MRPDRRRRRHFSDLVARAEAGEEIVISRGNHSVARLEPRPQRRPGRLCHFMSDADWEALIAAIEAPMRENELDEAEGSPLFGETA